MPKNKVYEPITVKVRNLGYAVLLYNILFANDLVN